jgi:hypothetical protein
LEQALSSGKSSVSATVVAAVAAHRIIVIVPPGVCIIVRDAMVIDAMVFDAMVIIAANGSLATHSDSQTARRSSPACTARPVDYSACR